MENLHLNNRAAKITTRRRTIAIGNYVAKNQTPLLLRKVGNRSFISRRGSVHAKMLTDSSNAAGNSAGSKSTEVNLSKGSQPNLNGNISPKVNDANKENVASTGILLPFLPTVNLKSDSAIMQEPILDITVPSTLNLPKPLTPTNEQKGHQRTILDINVPSTLNLPKPLTPINKQKGLQRTIPDLIPVTEVKKTYGSTKTGQHILRFLDNFDRENKRTVPKDSININDHSMDVDEDFGKLEYSDDSD